MTQMTATVADIKNWVEEKHLSQKVIDRIVEASRKVSDERIALGYEAFREKYEPVRSFDYDFIHTVRVTIQVDTITITAAVEDGGVFSQFDMRRKLSFLRRICTFACCSACFCCCCFAFRTVAFQRTTKDNMSTDVFMKSYAKRADEAQAARTTVVG